MNDATVSLLRVYASIAWSVVALMIGSAWVSFALGYPHLAALLGFTGCASSAVAACLTIQGYTNQICRVVRVSRSPSSDGGVLPFR